MYVFARTHETVELFSEGLEVACFFLVAGRNDCLDKDIDEMKALPETALYTFVLDR